jgi:hypothetical protein
MVRLDNDKEFLKKTFQDMLKGEGIQFNVCRNRDVKCSVNELVHSTIRDKLYKYFTKWIYFPIMHHYELSPF